MTKTFGGGPGVETAFLVPLMLAVTWANHHETSEYACCTRPVAGFPPPLISQNLTLDTIGMLSLSPVIQPRLNSVPAYLLQQLNIFDGG